MKFDESISKELSIRSEYADDFSEKSTKLMIAFNNALISGNLTELDQISKQAKDLKDLQMILEEDIELFKLYSAFMITNSVETAKKNGLPKDIAEVIKKKYFYKIIQSKSMFELETLNVMAFEELVKALKSYSFKHYSLIIKMALEYIHNNKFKFIYSKDVATAINVNRSYLSKRFKIEVGETITDYIHKTKMDLSIELLANNIYHFNEVAELLGYQNYSYFSKVFKKYYHMSPVEYMKK